MDEGCETASFAIHSVPGAVPELSQCCPTLSQRLSRFVPEAVPRCVPRCPH